MEKLKSWTSSNLETNNPNNNNNNSTSEMSESMSHNHHQQNTSTIPPANASHMDSNSQIKCLVVASTTPDGKQISSIYKDIKVSESMRAEKNDVFLI